MLLAHTCTYMWFSSTSGEYSMYTLLFTCLSFSLFLCLCVTLVSVYRCTLSMCLYFTLYYMCLIRVHSSGPYHMATTTRWDIPFSFRHCKECNNESVCSCVRICEECI